MDSSSEKATFQIIFGKNCENTAAKKPETRSKVNFLFETASILSKKSAHKTGSKGRKKPAVETNLDSN